MDTPNNNEFYVYTHTRKSDGIVFYVGKGKGNRDTITCHRSKRWNNTAKKHGFFATKVAQGLSESEAFALEVRLISDYRKESGNKLVNITDGGEGSTGLKHTEEFKTYISNLNKGKTRVFTEAHLAKLREVYARRRGSKLSETTKEALREAAKNRPPISEETRRKLSAAKKGKVNSPEAIEIMRKKLTGRKLSDETKAKISAFNKGRVKSPEHLKKMADGIRAAYERKRNSTPASCNEVFHNV